LINLGTIGAILGAIASFLAIVATLSQKIRDNGARLQTEKGRVIALWKIVESQVKRYYPFRRRSISTEPTYSLKVEVG
jgi:hypothetical protein